MTANHAPAQAFSGFPEVLRGVAMAMERQDGGAAHCLSQDWIFMCHSCGTVLTDSWNLCDTHSALQVIIVLRLTDDVIVEPKMQVFLGGPLKGCAYLCLRCRSCNAIVGFSLCSANDAFLALRSLFCLHKKQVTCYMLNSRVVIPGIQFHMKLQPLSGQIEELKNDLVKLHFQIGMD
uniref:Mis18 domain-containing protein n=1 Tax=Leptobrachium leishanense TaxID=445787 RepID=A0A8C5R9Z5_9ANUR